MLLGRNETSHLNIYKFVVVVGCLMHERRPQNTYSEQQEMLHCENYDRELAHIFIGTTEMIASSFIVWYEYIIFNT